MKIEMVSADELFLVVCVIPTPHGGSIYQLIKAELENLVEANQVSLLEVLTKQQEVYASRRK
ncbi:hypothetical protein NMG60_11035629 [Bertholletia excelsa]